MDLPIITLLSDFGFQDGYVAAMKGVILTICRHARLVDISHFISPQNVRSAAFVLSSCYGYFPRGTVHLSVVDPGVGSERAAIAVKTRTSFLVGPDNGIFSLILKKEAQWEARKLENMQLRLSPMSRTFHGRDIFAPAAAHLASGWPFEEVGPECDPLCPNWMQPTISKGRIDGEVMHIDRFGNAIVNVTLEELEKQGTAEKWTLSVGRSKIGSIRQTYCEVRTGEALALTGSSGYIEIAVNQGNAASKLKLNVGARVILLLLEN